MRELDLTIMAGLVPAVHVFDVAYKKSFLELWF
jgi:hypothetical protein